MPNHSWSLLAGGATIGVIAGFALAVRWQEPTTAPTGLGVPAPRAAADPNPLVVKAVETQAARITKLEGEVEQLSKTVRDLSRALRAATDGNVGRAGDGERSSTTLPWLPPGALEVAKAWYAERIAAGIQQLAERVDADTTADDAQKRSWAEEAQRAAAHLTSLRGVFTEAQFAQWLQSSGHGARIPSRDELTATAAELKHGSK